MGAIIRRRNRKLRLKVAAKLQKRQSGFAAVRAAEIQKMIRISQREDLFLKLNKISGREGKRGKCQMWE